MPDSQATETVVVEALPLTPEHEELLFALDRMLTTGTYYPPGHAQYVAVADQCAKAVAAALRGETSVEIQITPEGVTIGETKALKTDRCVRRVHELLEPLNQALLEIHADVTTDDLHAALVTLKANHKQLAGTRDYQEIEIEGMPETVNVIGRSLYVRTKAGNGPQKTESPVNEYFDPNSIPDAALVPTPEGQMMEREFLAVIQGLMQGGNAEKLLALQDSAADDTTELLGTWVPDHAIRTIKEILDTLESTNSDPMMLQHLVGHAQEALQLTGDPALVELVFEKLRKENVTKPKSRRLLENRPKPNRKPVRFTMSRDELRRLIEEVNGLAEDQGEAEDLISPANADCMGICIQILHVAPTDQLADGIASTLHQILTSEELSEMDLRVATDAMTAVFRGTNSETTDLIATMVTTPLRKAHPAKLGPMWLSVWQSLGSFKEKERAWPHVVNDVLMGLKWENPREKLVLYQELSTVDVNERVDLLVKLETLQAMQEKILAKDLFHAPPPLLYGLHHMLMNSSIAELHGPLMHQRLAYQKAHSLATILMDGFVEYNHAHRKAYQAILFQGVQEKIVPELQDIAMRHLKGTLNRLSSDRREERWVTEAIGWLGKLGTNKTRPVIEKILNEKKFFFFPVWPASCRDAAREALAGVDQTDERDSLVEY